MNKTCSTCQHWKPGEKAQLGSLTTKKDPWCMVWKTVKYEEDKPVSWCYKAKEEEQNNADSQSKDH